MAMLRQRQGSGVGHGGALPTNYGNGNGGGGLGVGYGGGSYDSYNSNAHYSTGKTKRPSHSAAPFLNSKVLMVAFSIFLFFCTTVYYRSSAKSVSQGINDIMIELNVKNAKEAVGAIRNLLKDRDQLHSQNINYQRRDKGDDTLLQRVRDLESTNRDLTMQNRELVANKAGNQNKDQVDKLMKREFAWRKQVGTLQKQASRNSHRSVIEKFGPGPHRVKFALRFSNDEDKLEYFTIELAPVEMMPHSVHLFLEQVYHELWDYTWIYLNGAHILQAGPQSYEDEIEDEEAYAKFEEKELDQLAFPEYNAKFPHVAWTLGMTGRPGGPDFYINKNDNTHVHGPGGQTQHALAEQADPCFAKVVDGFSTLQKIYKMDVYDDSDYADFLEDPVEITWARIETPLPEETKPQQTNEEIVAQAKRHHHDKKHKPKLDHRVDQHKEEYDVSIEDAE